MRKRGTIGQFLTSLPALIGLILIMVIFVFASSALGELRDFSSDDFEEEFYLNNEALMPNFIARLFVSDVISFQGNEENVGDVLARISALPIYNEERNRLIKIVSDKWEEEYSCDGKNEFIFEVWNNDIGNFEVVLISPLNAEDISDKEVFSIVDEFSNPLIRQTVKGGELC